MRARGTIGDLRRALREATYRLAQEHDGVTWMQAVQAAGLALGRAELKRARWAMQDMQRAGDLQCLGPAPRSGTGRPPVLYAPAQPISRAAGELDQVLRTWCAPPQGQPQD